MTVLLDLADYFHFIRPWWLALVPLALLLWWRVRHRATARPAPPAGIAPHLAEALTVGGGGVRRLLPIDGVLAAITLLAVGAAGPTWSRVPNPLVDETAPLAIALEVTDSMLDPDVPPSRLERAKQKITDVIAARSGARTALIAYAGSAHRVAPLTEDLAVIAPFIEGLSPEIMPVEGQNAGAALALAREALTAEEVPGAILFVLDSLDSADLPAFASNEAEGGPPVVFLALGDDASSDGLERAAGAVVVSVTPDDSDVRAIGRHVASAYRDALARDDRLAWADRGWLLAWPAALLVLIWFRRGWTMRWAGVVVLVMAGMQGNEAKASGIADWFFTPDQQGRLAFEEKNYDRAAQLFEAPMWRGYALYRAGSYEEAAEVYARLDTAEAAFAEGMARIRSRGYRPAIAALEKALERDPGHAAAARNLEIARAILDYVETAREQSDTGEESGIGADEVVFDNEAARGAETIIDDDSAMTMETAEQWMRSVDTRTADFLRSCFALEAAGQP